MHIFDIIVFIAKWLLFIFPIYQGIIEFLRRNNIIDFNETHSSKYPKIPVWYWILPPLKIHLEKVRINKLLKDSHIKEADAENLYFISNKATAWFYISLAGLLEGIEATHSLLASFDIKLPIYSFILLICIIIILSIISIIYRLSDNRKNTFFKKWGILTDEEIK